MTCIYKKNSTGEMKQLYFLLIMLAVLCSCRNPENVGSSKKVYVSFYLNDSIVSDYNRFSVFLINQHDTARVVTRGNELLLPDLSENGLYTIMLQYNSDTLVFDKITGRMLRPVQDYELKFGIQLLPMKDNTKGLLTSEEFEQQGSFKKLHYLQFNLYEEGDGILFVNKF